MKSRVWLIGNAKPGVKGAGPSGQNERNTIPQPVQLLTQKDLPRQGLGLEDKAEASLLRNNSQPFQKPSPPRLLATNKWGQVETLLR